MTEVWTGHGQIAIFALALAFAVGLAILFFWVWLPFGVFGTKPLLRELIAAQKETNRKLDEIRRELAEIDRKQPPPWGTSGKGGLDF